MSKTVEVKVIELAGQELKPGAKYLFVIHRAAMAYDDIRDIAHQLQELIGPNFAIGLTRMPIDETLKVYEFAPESDQVGLHDEIPPVIRLGKAASKALDKMQSVGPCGICGGGGTGDHESCLADEYAQINREDYE